MDATGARPSMLRGTVVTLPQNELDLRENEDFHPIDRRDFPDGFIHFQA